MANDKNNINELVDDYCQMAGLPDLVARTIGRLRAWWFGNVTSGARNEVCAREDRPPETRHDEKRSDSIFNKDQYADQLRWQIRDFQATFAAQSEQLNKICEESEEKSKQLVQLKAHLANARKTIPALHEKNRLSIERHNREILALQVQLENTDSSLRDADVQNQDLAHQLLILRDSRESLRSKWRKKNIKTERRIKALKAKCKKIARQNTEYEEQLDAKNKAVHSLLSQLAPKTAPGENEADLTGTVEVIDYSLYEPVLDESDGDSSIEPDRTSDNSSETGRRELVGRIDGSRMSFALGKDRLTIGRTTENDIQLTPSYISRRHAIIVTEDGKTRVVDSGSTNGVFVNSRRVREHSLSDGDVVGVGFAKFIYREQPEASV